MREKTTIKTTFGEITGLRRDGCTELRGIKFAEAERFQNPHTVPPQGGYDASNYRSMFPQPGYPAGSFYDREFWGDAEYCLPESEDSLYLNIWMPEDGLEKHPVAIWYHGGAFVNGAGSKVEVDGSSFARQGIVFVSANYRLGALGYMCLEELEREFGFTGNYGLADQLCAIEWVHRYIADFGGDAEDICIMGQSAGAMSVQTLVSSPMLPKCVKRAVMQSGGGYDNRMNSNFTVERQRKVCAELLNRCGISGLDTLMSMDAKELVMLCDKNDRKRDDEPMIFCPVIDGRLLPVDYEASVREGKTADIPYLLGCTRNDIFVTGDVFESRVFKGCTEWSTESVRAGHQPSYVYLFDRAPLSGSGEGAFHSCDLWYSFNSLGRSWREKTAEDYRLAAEMNRLWGNFIKTGNPNDAEWRRYTESDPCVKILGV